VIGVIEPGAAAAVNASKNGRVGIIGTRATIGSEAYAGAIRYRKPDMDMVSMPCPLFVPIVEEGWSDTEVARITALEYLKPIMERDVDTVVMGCTHYPLLKNVIGSIMGDAVTLIDPAFETAREFKDLLYGSKMERLDASLPEHRYYVSDDPLKFVKVGAAFLEREIDNIEEVNIEKN
jgi:glutamate racemase